MAVSYGSTYGYGGFMWQVGVEGSASTPNTTTGAVTVYSNVYIKCTSSSEGALSGGSWRAYVAGSLQDSGSAVGTGYNAYGRKVGFGTRAYTASHTGTSTVTVTGNLDIIAGASQSVTIPIWPYNAPAAPTGATATRVSDTQYTVGWTNTDPTNADAPYANVVVERSVDGGLWAAVATLGVVSSYTAATEADRSYAFRVKATNRDASSGYATTATVYTTPAAPTIGSATKTGADIVVTWDHTARYATGAKVYGSNNGGAYSLVGTVSTTAETYTHASPTGAWAYKVTATNGSLESAQSGASNTVATLQAPNAPTILAPTGVVDAAGVVTFQWQHNPTDTTAQTAYELQYRETGGTFTTLSGTTAASRALTAATLTNSKTYEVQVRTKGAHADWSPWSTLGSFPTSARPTATINAPTGTIITSTITAVWGYYDAEGTAQAQWRASLLSGATVVETKSGTGTADTTTFATTVPEGEWTVTVEVMDGSGLWSAVASETVTVEYAVPPAPTVTATYGPATGSVAILLDNPAPVSPEVDPVHNNVYRSTDGGVTWVLIGSQVSVGGSMVDPLPVVGGVTRYRADAVSASPSIATSEDVIVDSSTSHGGWCFANFGAGFGEQVRLRANVSVDSGNSRTKKLTTFSQREYPTEYLRAAKVHTLSISTMLTPTGILDESTWQELEALADVPAPVCWRDPTGRRVFCSVGQTGSVHRAMAGDGTLTLTRVHHVE